MSILKRYKRSGGFEAILKLVETSAPKTQLNILESIEREDPEYAQKIKDNLFHFDDVMGQEEKTLTKLFKKVPAKVISYAIYPYDPKEQERILFHLDEKVKKSVKDEYEIIQNNINQSLINTAQKKIISTARDLEAEGYFKLKKVSNKKLLHEIHKMTNNDATRTTSENKDQDSANKKKEFKSIYVTDIVLDERLTQDLYLFQNNRFILFKKIDEVINKLDLENLKKHNVLYMFVEINE